MEIISNRQNTEPFDKEHCCCFTGHRPEKLSYDEMKIKRILMQEIYEAIREEMTIFICGMARGVDIWAAELVIEIKRQNPNIKLICAIPYEDFEKIGRRSGNADIPIYYLKLTI